MPRPKKNPTAPEPAPVPMYAYAGVTQAAASVAPVPQQVQLSGLYVFGQIADRTKRTIPTRDNGTAEIVTYTVRDVNGRNYYVDEYDPEVYNDLGAIVEIPVYVKTFKKRNGDIGYSFSVQQQQGSSSRGVRF